MAYENLRDKIEKNYSLNITNIEKVKSAFKISTSEGRYCLKCVKYQYPHFYFIQEVMKHLIKNKFDNIPEIMKTNDGIDYIELENSYAYITKWINSRESNYDNPIELGEVSRGLAKLHLSSKGFLVNDAMKPRIGWGSWIDVFSTRNEEILDFKKRINQKANLDSFDRLYLKSIEREIERGQKSIEGLKNSKYMELMSKEVIGLGFCHHDIANHNVLIDNNKKLYFIDFDYCILDSHLHDLSSLIIRALKNGKWNKEKSRIILENYNIISPISYDEIEVMSEFMRYPQGFWQIGLQKYWEQQPWDENKFLSRLTNYIDDCEDREEFIDLYFRGGDWY